MRLNKRLLDLTLVMGDFLELIIYLLDKYLLGLYFMLGICIMNNIRKILIFIEFIF